MTTNTDGTERMTTYFDDDRIRSNLVVMVVVVLGTPSTKAGEENLVRLTSKQMGQCKDSSKLVRRLLIGFSPNFFQSSTSRETSMFF